jgi:transposase
LSAFAANFGSFDSLECPDTVRRELVGQLVTGDGHRLLPRVAGEIAREIQRLAIVQEQIVEIERERDTASTACEATERKRDLLSQLKSVGPTISAFLSREVYYRQFANQRQVVTDEASQAGFADDPKAYRAVVEAERARTAGVGEMAAIEE